VSRVSGAHLRGFAPEPTHQSCSGGESLATCGRFNRLGILNQRQISYHSLLCFRRYFNSKSKQEKIL